MRTSKTALTAIREEPRAGEGPRGVSDPGPDPARGGWEHLPKHRLAIEEPPHSHCLRQDEHPGHSRRAPPSLSLDNPWREACLLVELATDRLDGRNRRLYLDHDAATLNGIEGEHVDRAALAEFAVRHLKLDRPSHRLEPRCDEPDEADMILIEEPLEVSTPPRRRQLDPRLERGEHAADRFEARRIEVPSLHRRDVRLRDPSPSREVDLAPASPPAERAEDPAGNDVVHPFDRDGNGLAPDHPQMDHDDHVALIRPGIEGSGRRWLELGAGEGAFTLALADVLGAGGEIVALDRDRRPLDVAREAVAARFSDARLETTVADFTRDLPVGPFDGVLAANSLHFVRDRRAVLAAIRDALAPAGRLVVVEYDADHGNPWVPHPFSLDTWRREAQIAGFDEPRVLRRVPSRFLGAIYGAVAVRRPDAAD